jgi:hypothetical protein
VRTADGGFLVSTGHSVVRIRADGGSKSELFAEFDGTVGALALAPDGRLYAAVAGQGVALLDAGGRRIGQIGEAGGRRLGCVTAIAWAADGEVLVTDGSAANDAEHWLQDLMEKRPASGRLIACKPDLSDARVLADGLSWPAGVAVGRGGDRALVTEAWTHRLISVPRAGGERKVLVKNFAGYPCRIAPASKHGYWIAFFSLRTQLTEFILREDDFRARMMAEVPPSLWIGPTLGGVFDYREPTQIGRIKKLGIQKPWAPARSYGLVARVDESGTAIESLHSRVSGHLHGVTQATEADGRLYFVAKGHGKLCAVDLTEAGGRP